MPSYIDPELRSAAYLVRVTGIWTSPITINRLKKEGYVQVDDPVFRKTAYSLWHRPTKKKKKPASTQPAPSAHMDNYATPTG